MASAPPKLTTGDVLKDLIRHRQGLVGPKRHKSTPAPDPETKVIMKIANELDKAALTEMDMRLSKMCTLSDDQHETFHYLMASLLDAGYLSWKTLAMDIYVCSSVVMAAMSKGDYGLSLQLVDWSEEAFKRPHVRQFIEQHGGWEAITDDKHSQQRACERYDFKYKEVESSRVHHVQNPLPRTGGPRSPAQRRHFNRSIDEQLAEVDANLADIEAEVSELRVREGGRPFSRPTSGARPGCGANIGSIDPEEMLLRMKKSAADLEKYLNSPKK